MTVEEYFIIWKKETGINYVEGQEDLFVFAEDYAAKQIKELKEALQGSHDLIALCLDDVKCDANLWDEVQEANKRALK